MSPVDGRLVVNGWKEIYDIYNLTEPGDKIIGVLHLGHACRALLLHTIAKGVGDE